MKKKPEPDIVYNGPTLAPDNPGVVRPIYDPMNENTWPHCPEGVTPGMPVPENALLAEPQPMDAEGNPIPTPPETDQETNPDATPGTDNT